MFMGLGWLLNNLTKEAPAATRPIRPRPMARVK